MAASVRPEDLEPHKMPDPAPQPAVAAPSSVLPADIAHPEEPAFIGSPTEPLPDLTSEPRHEAVARAAYYLAQARGFGPGHELDDWLAAEQQISSH